MMVATRRQEGNRTESIVLSLSATAGQCLSRVLGRDFERTELVGYLLEHYQVSPEVAERDISELIARLRHEGILIQ